MWNNEKKKSPMRFLTYSFIGLLIFSVVVFTLLGIHMNRESKEAFYEVGEIYMSGMNQQMSEHFESVIKLRFDQVSGIISVVSTVLFLLFQKRETVKIYTMNSFTDRWPEILII